MPLGDARLPSADGLLFRRMEKLYDREVPGLLAVHGPYISERFGFEKSSTPLMMATMITGNLRTLKTCANIPPLRRAQRDIDLRPELYTPLL